MRKIFLFFIAVSMMSCSAQVYYYKSVAYSPVDFRPYTESGFFITESNSVGFDYKPVSLVFAYVASGYLPDENNIATDTGESFEPVSSTFRDDMYYRPKRVKPVDISKLEYRAATQADAVEKLVQAAKELGANGIINLKLQVDYGEVGLDPTYSATGMAIIKQ